MVDYTTQDAVNFAADGNGVEFKKAVNDLLMDRVRDAVELKKSEVAANFLSVEDEAEEQNVEGDDYDDQEV
jgi:hypothetical protein